MDKYVERIFKKISLKLNTASHNNASWCTDADGFLEHYPSRGHLYYKRPALQRMIPVLGGPPLYLINMYKVKINDLNKIHTQNSTAVIPFPLKYMLPAIPMLINHNAYIIS